MWLVGGGRGGGGGGVFFFQAEDGIRVAQESRGLGDVYKRQVDNLVMKLRKKIEKNPDTPRVLLTVYGAGYKFVG